MMPRDDAGCFAERQRARITFWFDFAAGYKGDYLGVHCTLGKRLDSRERYRNLHNARLGW